MPGKWQLRYNLKLFLLNKVPLNPIALRMAKTPQSFGCGVLAVMSAIGLTSEFKYALVYRNVAVKFCLVYCLASVGTKVLV